VALSETEVRDLAAGAPVMSTYGHPSDKAARARVLAAAVPPVLVLDGLLVASARLCNAPTQRVCRTNAERSERRSWMPFQRREQTTISASAYDGGSRAQADQLRDAGEHVPEVDVIAIRSG